jgi:hypothetical protein
MALNPPPLQTRELPSALSDTYKVIRRLNRNTTWVATGLLGSVVFAALMVALQERHPKADDLTKEARQTTGDLLVNANPIALSNVVDPNGKSIDKITSGPATSVDPGFAPEINRPDVQANVSSSSPAHGPDSVQVIRPKMPKVRYRTFVRHRTLDVKMRLIALWHQSLAQSEKSRTWTFSNSNKGERRKSVTPPRRTIDRSGFGYGGSALITPPCPTWLQS